MRFIPVAICFLLITTACKDLSASPPGPCRLPEAHSPSIQHSVLITGQANLDNYPTPNTGLGRACRSDYFVIDVPVALPGIDNLCSDLGAQLDLWLAENMGRIGKTWTSQSLVSEMFSIRPNGKFDQHCLLNFNGGSGALIPIPPQAQCDAVATIRAALVDVVGPNQAATLLVARECDAHTQSGTLWHKAALDLPDEVVSGGDGVSIAVIDTPIDPAVFTPAECGSACDMSSQPARHGAAIGALLRTIAPEADLKFYIGLSEAVGGAVTDVTMALHRALDDQGSDPLVINMSLGWPPEMGQMTQLTGKKLTRHSRRYLGLGPQANLCKIIEDPVGESTRRALLRARDAGNVIVLAAAGNRLESTIPPAHLAPPLALVEQVHQGRLPDCGATTLSAGINHTAAFFPAAWGEPITCLDPATGQYETLLLGVDQFSQRVSPTRDQNPRTLLRAPGHRIRVDYTTTGSVDMTWVINGTSAATAIASGVAARLLSLETEVHSSEELRNIVLSHAIPDPRAPNNVWLAAVEPKFFEDLVATEPVPVCLPGGHTPRESAVPGGSFTHTTGTSIWPDAYGQGTAVPQPLDWCGEDCLIFLESFEPSALGSVTVKTSVLNYLKGDLKLTFSDGVNEWSLPLGDKGFLQSYTGSLTKIGIELPSTLSGDKLDFWVSGYFDDGKSSSYYTSTLPVYVDP